MIKEPPCDRTLEIADFMNFRSKLVDERRIKARRQEYELPVIEQRQWSRRPNILWLMTNQLRADVFGAVGHPMVKTPNMDRLIEQGTVFERCFCSSPVCMPARASLMTGHIPASHGVLQNGMKMRDAETVFPPLCKEAGYRTANIGKHH